MSNVGKPVHTVYFSCADLEEGGGGPPEKSRNHRVS